MWRYDPVSATTAFAAALSGGGVLDIEQDDETGWFQRNGNRNNVVKTATTGGGTVEMITDSFATAPALRLGSAGVRFI